MAGAAVLLHEDPSGASRPMPANDPPPAPGIVTGIVVDGQENFVSEVEGLTMTGKGSGTDLRLIRGITTNTFFTDWINELRTEGKTAARHDVRIDLYDTTLALIKSFNVTGAVPVSVSIEPINSTSVALEILTLSYQNISPA
jgi:hypothetical protein